jgi:type IV pilus assembly protein PilX
MHHLVSTKHHMAKASRFGQHNRGFVMVVVMVFLVILTLIGLSGMRTTRVQEQMAGTGFERVTAMAASHAGLSDGRDYVLQPDFDPNSGAFRVRDVSASALIGTTSEGWTVSSWLLANTDWYGGVDALPLGAGNGETYTLARVNRNPAFIVDRLPSEQTQNAVPFQVFRVTARGEGARADNAALTQSIIRIPVPQ